VGMGKIYPGNDSERTDEAKEARYEEGQRGDELLPELAPKSRTPNTGVAKSVDPRGWVSLVIPARNEEQCIAEVIEKSLPFCDEIVVVDGHSVDRTVQVAESYGVRVVKDNKRGKGEAIRVGAMAATHGIVVFMDADGSHDPADIPHLTELILDGRADLVIGSRGRGGSDEAHGDIDKLLRMIGCDIILIGINMRWKKKFTESQNGFRAIRTEVVRSLDLKENITTIEQEMMMKALKRGYVVAEVPAHEYSRKHGKSSIRLHRVWFRYIYSFIKNLF
jgi:glycosyltransferase involved in cell wall biosynthesis